LWELTFSIETVRGIHVGFMPYFINGTGTMKSGKQLVRGIEYEYVVRGAVFISVYDTWRDNDHAGIRVSDEH